MQYKVVAINVVFSGLYEWGTGYVSNEKRLLWEKFWNSHKGNYWKLARTESGNQYLYGLHGSIYLHPERFEALLSCESYTNNNGAMSELDEIIEACAKACGVTYTFSASDEKTIEFSL